jgi:hypothetical protein
MHEENTRSTRHSYRASRVPKTQLNVAIENVGKIPRICGGGGGGITAASSGSSGDKEDENYVFFHNGDDIGNDIGGFGDTNNADESVVLDGCNNEFNVVNNDDDLVDDEVSEHNTTTSSGCITYYHTYKQYTIHIGILHLLVLLLALLCNVNRYVFLFYY